jgi:hypothetical protein
MPVSRRRHRTPRQRRESRRVRSIMQAIHHAYVAALRGAITPQIFARLRRQSRAELLGLDPFLFQAQG